MSLATEAELKRRAHERLPDYYAEIVDRCQDTFAYAIMIVKSRPTAKAGSVWLATPGPSPRPHTAAGALKGINDAIALGEALTTHSSLEAALSQWDTTRTDTNNDLVRFGNQLGRALVWKFPTGRIWTRASMERWFTSIVTIKTEVLDPNRHSVDAAQP